MSNPRLTIGIPFYNAAGTLLDAIRSIFAQTYQDWELILAYDGSTDGSDELASRVKDNRVRVIGDRKRRYVAYRLNQIIRESRGEFIARMDADDLSAPTRIAKQIRFLQDHPEVDACGTGWYGMTQDMKLSGVSPSRRLTHKRIFEEPLKDVNILHASLVARAEWYRTKMYDEDLVQSQDQALWLKCWKTSCLANICEPLYLYRGVDNMSVRRYWQTMHNQAKAYLRFGQTSGLTDKAKLAAVRSYVHAVAYTILSPMKLVHVFSRRAGAEKATEADHQKFVAILKKIMGTDVPLSDA